MANVLNLQKNIEGRAEQAHPESSLNIFEDTTPEKWGAHFASKIKGALGGASRDREGKWVVSGELVTSTYESDAPQKMGKHYSEFMAANTIAKSESEEFATLAMNGEAEQAIQMTIQSWAEGAAVNVSKFENYIYRLFELGEMNGQSDRRWFYLAKSLETKNKNGQPLLADTFLSRLGQLVGVNPVLDFLDDRNFSKDKFTSYFKNMDMGNLDHVALAKANASWFVRDVSEPHSDADLRANKVDLTKIDRDDVGMLPLLIDPERLKSIVAKRHTVDDRFIENLVGSFKTNYDETIIFLKELKYSNAPNYRERLLKLGKMLKTYGTTVASESFAALPENLHSQSYSKSEIRSQVLIEMQKLAGTNSNNAAELFNSADFESIAGLERLVSGGAYVMAA
jgi:hypothetical protein